MDWYYAEGKEEKGPVSEEDLRGLFASGKVNEETAVWSEGMDEWRPFNKMIKSDEPVDGMVTCSISGNQVPQDQAVQIGGKWVSAENKEQALQALKQGEQVVGAMNYAGFWIRVLARIIDGIITSIVSYALMFLVMMPLMLSGGSSSPDSGSSIAVMIFSQLLMFLIPFAYEVWMVGKYRATLGKMALGLKIVRSSSEPLTYGRAVGRYFGYILSSITLCIGFIIAAFDDEKRTLHDRICDTRVIKTK